MHGYVDMVEYRDYFLRQLQNMESRVAQWAEGVRDLYRAERKSLNALRPDTLVKKFIPEEWLRYDEKPESGHQTSNSMIGTKRH